MDKNLSNSSWRSYRRRRATLWIFLPVLFVVISMPSLVFSGWITLMGFAPAIISLIAMQFFKCPRCGKAFFYDYMWRPWADTCLHCGLPKWKEADHVDPDSGRAAYRTRSIAEMAADPAIPALQRNSRFLTLVLRDDPGAIHLTLDSDGWADVNNLLTRANRYGFKLTREDLAELPAVSESHRFEWDQSGDRIRWNKS